jgi:hypothetical protein
MVDKSATAAAARECMERYGVDWFGILDGKKLLGWAWASDLDGSSLAGIEPKPFEVRLSLDASLREALDTIITSHTRVAPVFDGNRFVGTITAEGISRELAK